MIFTSPNADHESRIIKKMIKNFVKKKSNTYFVNSFGQKYFFSNASCKRNSWKFI